MGDLPRSFTQVAGAQALWLSPSAFPGTLAGHLIRRQSGPGPMIQHDMPISKVTAYLTVPQCQPSVSFFNLKA